MRIKLKIHWIVVPQFFFVEFKGNEKNSGTCVNLSRVSNWHFINEMLGKLHQTQFRIFKILDCSKFIYIWKYFECFICSVFADVSLFFARVFDINKRQFYFMFTTQWFLRCDDFTTIFFFAFVHFFFASMVLKHLFKRFTSTWTQRIRKTYKKVVFGEYVFFCSLLNNKRIKPNKTYNI